MYQLPHSPLIEDRDATRTPTYSHLARTVYFIAGTGFDPASSSFCPPVAAG